MVKNIFLSGGKLCWIVKMGSGYLDCYERNNKCWFFIIYLRGKNFVNSIKWVLFLVGYLFLLFGEVWWMGFGRVRFIFDRSRFW